MEGSYPSLGFLVNRVKKNNSGKRQGSLVTGKSNISVQNLHVPPLHFLDLCFSPNFSILIYISLFSAGTLDTPVYKTNFQ